MGDSSLLSPKAAVMGGASRISQPPPPPSVEKDGLKRDNASVNAVSFGFVATAVLISMFLVMAIFERFLRPRSSFSSVSTLRGRESTGRENTTGGGSLKSDDRIIETVSGISVLMPGQEIPTFIAKPVPISCPRVGMPWPGYTGSCSCDTSPTSGKINREPSHQSLEMNGASNVAVQENSANDVLR